MAEENKNLTQLDTAGPLTGDELMYLVQDGDDVSLEIKDLPVSDLMQDALDEKQDVEQVKDTSFTAEVGKSYVITASATVADPTLRPDGSAIENGDKYEVRVSAGTATIDSVGYSTVGMTLLRAYNSGAWSTVVESYRPRTVADDTARFALTAGDVGVGQLIQVTSTGNNYIIVDLAQLGDEDGYVILPPAGPAQVIVRQGTAAEIAVITLASGEFGYATDTKYIYMGDGATLGGVLISANSLIVQKNSLATAGTNLGGSGTVGSAGSGTPKLEIRGGIGGSNHATGTGNGGNGGVLSSLPFTSRGGNGGAGGISANGGTGGSNATGTISFTGGTGGAGGVGVGGNGGAARSILLAGGNGGAGAAASTYTGGTGGAIGKISGGAIYFQGGAGGAGGTFGPGGVGGATGQILMWGGVGGGGGVGVTGIGGAGGVGGDIIIKGGDAVGDAPGGAAGTLTMNGGAGSSPTVTGGAAGSITTSANSARAGGSINTSAGASAAGGSINISNSGIIINTGTGTPEGVVTAVVGSLFLRTDGGANTTLYVKESGTGNTGWVGK